MFGELFTLIFTFVIVSGSSEKLKPTCQKWTAHKNFHLVHSGGVCGQLKVKKKDKIISKIFNGKVAATGSVPWMAYIVINTGNDFFACSGSVINENYVLTAAHCINFENPITTVVLGLQDRNVMKDSFAEKYNVTKHIKHPEFDKLSKKNDIALLRVDRSISFESRKETYYIGYSYTYINYICLPTTCKLAQRDYLGENLTVAGWGLVTPDKQATSLQSAVFLSTECKGYSIQDVPQVPDESQLCTRSRAVMTCLGDSGGPLVHKSAERVVQVGVLSMGPGDCSSITSDQLDFYSRVSSYIGWILDNVSP